MSFVEMIIQRLRDAKQSTVLKEITSTGVKDIYAYALLHQIGSIQACLQKHRVEKGHRVVLIGPNSALWIAADVAIMSSGAICVPMYHRQEIGEIVFMIQDCEPTLVICADQSMATELKKRLLQGFTVITITQALGEPKLPRVVPISPKDCATFCYTSGTSGNPKGVMISVENIEYMLRQTRERLAKTLGKVNDERIFHFLPFCFMGSRIMLLTQLHRGKMLWLSTDLTKLKEELQASDPHYYLNVPAVLERIRTGVEDLMRAKPPVLRSLYEAAKQEKGLAGFLGRRIVLSSIKKKIGKNLKFLICGSAPLHPDTQRWFKQLGIPVLQVYGLTETTAIITMDELDSFTPGYVGAPIAKCEVKLTEEGELICKGPNVFMGYWKREEETKSMLREDGWLYTGDQAEVNEKGQYKILGRVKNLLVSESGHNIAPEPLEEKLMGLCPGIEHAVIIGHAKPYLTAIITGKATNEQIQAAIDELNQALPHYRKIKKFYVSPESLTAEKGLLTANQKLKRKVIETYFQKQVEQMYQGSGRAL